MAVRAEIFVTLCFFVTAVVGAESEQPRIHTPVAEPIDCKKMARSAPDSSLWVPQCDEGNRMRPLQVKKDGSTFCVDMYVASVLLEQTGTTVISCACVSEAKEMRRNSRKPLFVPECDQTTGSYQPKQCNRRGECWCVNVVDGRQIGPRWGKKTPLSAVLTSRDPTLLTVDHAEPRASCELISKYWSKWNSR